MVKIPKSSGGGGGDFKQPPTGKFAARVLDLHDLGFQKSDWQGNRKIKLEMRIVYVLAPTYKDDEGTERHYSISEWVTQSLHPKSKLTARVDSILFDDQGIPAEDLAIYEDTENGLDAAMVGAPCMVTVTEGATGKSKVKAVSSLDKRLADDAPPLPDGYTRWNERRGDDGELLNRPEPYPKDADEWLAGSSPQEHESHPDDDKPMPGPAADDASQDEIPF